MTHISKNQLAEKELHRLFNQFETTIAQIGKQTSEGFLDELLGPEEKIMLSKRLAAIVMFIEGNSSSYRVWQLLKMSPSTADRIKLNYEVGKYKNIEKILKSDRVSYMELWKSLEVILQAGLPPRGRGRWKSVFKSSE